MQTPVGDVDVDDVAVLIEQLEHGLTYARERGIVHGALTPETVIVDAAGLAKIEHLGAIEGQHVMESGSRALLPDSPYRPGGVQGNTLSSHALDVHALAAIAYEMLTGDPPSRISDVLPGSSFQAPHELNRAVPEQTSRVVTAGLAAFEQKSGLTAAEFSRDLTAWREIHSAPEIDPARSTVPGTPRDHGWPLPAATVPPVGDVEMRRQTGNLDREQDRSGETDRRPALNRSAWVLAAIALLLVSVVVGLLVASETLTLPAPPSRPSELEKILELPGQ